LDLSGVPLVAFHRHLQDAEDVEGARDLGLALVEMARLVDHLEADAVRKYLSKRALPLLTRATAHAPDDVAALEAYGFALFAQDRPDDALQALADALARAPDRETALDLATHVAQATGQLDLAEKYGQRLASKYPQCPDHLHRLAVIYAQRQAWPQALKATRAAVRADPFRAESRALLITVHFETGNRDRALAEFETLGVIQPDYQEKIRSWFAEQLKRTK
jgi:tetratricopeptide (TPR) repeat protein